MVPPVESVPPYGRVPNSIAAVDMPKREGGCLQHDIGGRTLHFGVQRPERAECMSSGAA